MEVGIKSDILDDITAGKKVFLYLINVEVLSYFSFVSEM
jgi:hypothetical protein